MNNPRISVLIPLYNAEKYIGETLESVLKQEYKEFEIVVIDDCGTDHSIDIVKKYQLTDKRIRIISNDRNRGIAYSRNRGLKECNGEYIALLDHDDIMVGERLKLQVDYLDKHPEIGAVGGNAQWIDENGKIIRGEIDIVQDPLEIMMFLLFRNILNNSEMTFRKSVIEENAIYYHEKCYGMEDFRFWIEFTKVSEITNLKENVLQKRMFDDNETSFMKTKHEEERKRKYLELQIFSLEKSGFVIDDAKKIILEKYMGEEHVKIKSYTELAELQYFFEDILEQAKNNGLKCYNNLRRWFLNLLEMQQVNVLEDVALGWGENQRVGYINHILEGKEFLEKQYQEQRKYIEEILEGKEFLEKQYQEQKKYIKEILGGKEFLEKQYQGQKKYIEEILEGKEFLEKQYQEQKKYIEEIVEGKEFLEKQYQEQKKYIEEILEGKEFLEKQYQEQKKYIEEILEGKEFLEKQYIEQKRYIEELLEGNKWLKLQLDKISK